MYDDDVVEVLLEAWKTHRSLHRDLSWIKPYRLFYECFTVEAARDWEDTQAYFDPSCGFIPTWPNDFDAMRVDDHDSMREVILALD